MLRSTLPPAALSASRRPNCVAKVTAGAPCRLPQRMARSWPGSVIVCRGKGSGAGSDLPKPAKDEKSKKGSRRSAAASIPPPSLSSPTSSADLTDESCAPTSEPATVSALAASKSPAAASARMRRSVASGSVDAMIKVMEAELGTVKITNLKLLAEVKAKDDALMAASQQLLDLQGLNEELSSKLAAAVSSVSALELETVGLHNKARWMDAAYEVLTANSKKKQARLRSAIVNQASSLSAELELVCSRVASLETLVSAFVSTRKADTPEPSTRPAKDLSTLAQRPEQAEAEAEVDASGDAALVAGRKWRRVTDLDLLSMRLEEADEATDTVVESVPDSAQLQPPPKSFRRQRPSSLPDLDDFSRMMGAGKEERENAAPVADVPEAEEDKRPLRVTNEVEELLQEEVATPVLSSEEAADQEEKGNIVPLDPRHAKFFTRAAAPALETADLAAVSPSSPPAVQPSASQARE